MNTHPDTTAYLSEKENEPAALRARFGREEKAYVDSLFAALEATDKRAANRAAKLIATQAEMSPPSLLPKWAALCALVMDGETIPKWNAMIALGHLAAGDRRRRAGALVPTLFRLLKDDSMVTAGHAITCLARIAGADAKSRPKILRALLAIESIPRNPSCRNILAGKVLTGLEAVMPKLGEKERMAVLDFARAQARSPRRSTAATAERLLRKRR